MIRKRWLAALLVLTATLAGAQQDALPLQQAVLDARRDVQAATHELTTLRAAHTAERRPLADRLADLQSDVKGLRAQAERLREARLLGQQEQESLVNEVAALDEQHRFVLSLLSEYRRSVEVRAGVAARQQIAPDLKAIDEHLALADRQPDLAPAARAVLSLAGRWNDTRYGGSRFPGAALDGDGIEQAGNYAVCGPAAYFVSQDGALAGLAVSRFGSLGVSVHTDIGAEARSAIADLASGREASVPVDVTAGDALKVAAARPTFVQHLRQGGIVMLPILVIAVWALCIMAYKFFQLRDVALPAPAVVTRIACAVRAGDPAAARSDAGLLGQPGNMLVLEGIEHRSASREGIEEILHERILTYVPILEKHLGALAVFGGVAPLLGLLGTVTGMIHTFQLVTVFGTGDAKLLSGGISEALVTTEFGLLVAIPVLLAHAYFSRRVRALIAGLEETAADFVNQLKAEDPA